MKFIKFIAAAAVATAFAAPASAATMGVANLTVNALFVQTFDNFGQPLPFFAPITTGLILDASKGSRQGSAGANFNGIQNAGNASGGAVAAVNVSARCVGPDCATLAAVYGGPVEDNTTFHMTAPSGNFAVGDMFISGSAIGAGGARGFTRADSSVTSASNSGGSSATIANSAFATTTFTVAQDVDAGFGIDYDAYVAAYIDPTTPAYINTNSLGANTFSLTLRRNNVIMFTWSPEELNAALSASESSENGVAASSGLLFSEGIKLVTGFTYSLTVSQSSNSTASEIPEPGTMVLAALGLFAAGVASRRRSK